MGVHFVMNIDYGRFGGFTASLLASFTPIQHVVVRINQNGARQKTT